MQTYHVEGSITVYGEAYIQAESETEAKYKWRTAFGYLNRYNQAEGPVSTIIESEVDDVTVIWEGETRGEL